MRHSVLHVGAADRQPRTGPHKPAGSALARNASRGGGSGRISAAAAYIAGHPRRAPLKAHAPLRSGFEHVAAPPPALAPRGRRGRRVRRGVAEGVEVAAGDRELCWRGCELGEARCAGYLQRVARSRARDVRGSACGHVQRPLAAEVEHPAGGNVLRMSAGVGRFRIGR